MGAGHSHALFVHEHSAVHRMAPPVKLVATLGIVGSIAVTPREAVWAFAFYAAAIGLLARVARVRLRFVAIRLLAVAPFVLFALFIPFVASGERIEVAGIDISVDGLWGAWNILAKALLGASTSILLTATTEVSDIIRGMGVLRVPALFTAIATFMIRYLQLVTDEVSRMRVAMTARGYDPRWISQVRPIATSAGALFVRSYERGERIHAAMVSRGFTGEMPALADSSVPRSQWLVATITVLVFAAIAALSLVVT